MNNHRLAAFAALSLMAGAAQAVETSFSGFMQVTAGRVLSGSGGETAVSLGYSPQTNPYAMPYALPSENYQCPCFVGNYEHVGIYDYHKTQLNPETLAGVQGGFTFTPDLSATVQVVARAADSTLNVDWAYATYKLAPNLSLQVGRKRLPLYYYSDFMYVGYAYPWVRPPQDLYGWQIYSYDGANLLYTTQWDRWSVTGNVWLGNRRDKDNDLLGKLYYGTQVEEAWKKMIGGYLDVTNDIVTARAVYMHTVVDRFTVANGVKSLTMSGENGGNVPRINGIGQSFYGLSINADYNNWLLRTEINYIDRPSVKNQYVAQAYSGGYQFGIHTVMLTWSQFREMSKYKYSTGLGLYETEKHTTQSISYRGDLFKSQAFKLQFDHVKDETEYTFTGNANMLSASWQYVF